MARDRSKGFNAKARQQRRDPRQKSTQEASNAAPEVLLEGPLAQVNEGNGNPLVLPAKKLKLSADAAVEDKEKPMSSKQKKRMEKFIEKQLKKEERVKILEKLSKETFVQQNSSLLRASKDIGRKDTVKDKLRRTLNEERAGIKVFSSDVPLVVERTLDSDDEVSVKDSVDAGEDDDDVKVGVDISSTLAGRGNPLKGPYTPTHTQKTSATTATTTSSTSLSKKRKRSGKSYPSSSQNPSISVFESSEESESENDGQEEDPVALPAPPKVVPEIQKSPIQPKPQQSKPVAQPVAQKKEVPPVTKKAKTNSIPAVKIDAPAKAFFVTVNRDPAIQEKRKELPIISEEQTIMEAILHHDFVIIAGETGSGKTTQVPQFLYEAGYGNPESPNPGMVGVTQPRRVAAISMASRVAQELRLTSKRVSYQVRYEGNATEQTTIKFMTDGVLLKEIATDFLLTKYSAIIIDEAHERNLNTDILIGLLSRIVPLRREMSREESADPKKVKVKPLKLIIMSATLRVADFTENRSLFPVFPPPVIKIDARQYPVTVHFNRKTPEVDYIAEAYKKACKIHKRLPAGGMLIFVTGQQEVITLVKKLKKKFPVRTVEEGEETKFGKKGKGKDKSKGKPRDEDEDEAENKDLAAPADALKPPATQPGVDSTLGLPEEDPDEAAKVIDQDDRNDADFDIGSDEEGDDLDDDDEGQFPEDDDEDSEDREAGPLHVLPLYALLPPVQQMRVFEPPPPGARLCVVATNVAETSLTIPNIVYVVDCGKAKERKYDLKTGTQSFEIDWISKASADQRAGRAGRTAPGHCYRLYSSAVYNDEFERFSVPEILRLPIEGIVLQMKSMNIDNVVNFPFPTPPDRQALNAAEKLLVTLGAVDKEKKVISDLGKMMAAFPVGPRYSKMLILGQQKGCLPYVVSIVAGLTVGDPFLRDVFLDDGDEDLDSKDEKDTKRRKRAEAHKVHLRFAGSPNTGDVTKLLRVIGAYEYTGGSDDFCDKNFLRAKAMKEIRQLRRQLTHIVNQLNPQADLVLDPKMKPPTATQEKLLRQIILAGFIDNVARLKKNYHLPNAYSTANTDSQDDALIHPSSSLRQEIPEWIVYCELFRSSKLFLKGVTVIDAEWIGKLGGPLCTYSKPLENPPPKFSRKKNTVVCFQRPAYGPFAWDLPVLEREYTQGPEQAKYYARFFLEGDIFPALKPFVPVLTTKPSTIIKTWTQPKIQAIVNPINRYGLTNRAKLERMWAEQPTFLLDAYLKWVDPKYHDQVKKIWPPVNDKNVPIIMLQAPALASEPGTRELASASESSDDDL